jgi:signal-transduction protein with cAMP-binding, CBS, and nucleotidyltransferase domain
MKVERVYTRSAVTTDRKACIRDAAEAMRRFHVGSLIVTEEARDGTEVVGIVTDRDLVVQALADALDARKVAVEKVMAPVVASVPEEADLLDALGRMRAAGVRRLLVTKGWGKPAGVLSIDDVLDGLVTELTDVVALMKGGIRRESADFEGSAGAAAHGG